ncbi:ABC transporter ATP-binding protein [Pararobbsia silviterrae]|uniref:ABC transporter ATP-binding protein n=1 Tax=Pararobbsia silviterrae TaxID=1792498 RepID=UPI001F0BF654|nr:ABC transporter ATP-binding protein [Pararobbsia silviterrae]
MHRNNDILELDRISRSFGSVCVADQLSLNVRNGEALGIIGPNGAGKTSLFNMITGAIRVDGGAIRFDGVPITDLPPHRRCRIGIARSHQVPRPFADMTVFENVLVGATFGADPHSGAATVPALRALERTGLLAKANQRAGALPLLDRKRLELARALATGPSLLLLDEIAGGLTEHEVAELIQTIRALRAEGLTIVWIEHIVHALLAVVDRLVVLNLGKVLLDGDPHEVMASEQVREIYLGADA